MPVYQESTPLQSWKLNFRHVNLQVFTESALLRKFPEAENINVTINTLNEVDITSKHTHALASLHGIITIT